MESFSENLTIEWSDFITRTKPRLSDSRGVGLLCRRAESGAEV
ncbi:MAG: hypothetical protein ABI851_14085 [Saprospiraceae bacterium]